MSGVLLKRSRWYSYYHTISSVRANRLLWRPKHVVLDDDPARPLRYTASSSHLGGASSQQTPSRRGVTLSRDADSGYRISLRHCVRIALANRGTEVRPA